MDERQTGEPGSDIGSRGSEQKVRSGIKNKELEQGVSQVKIPPGRTKIN
jgi:hypothetical protein